MYICLCIWANVYLLARPFGVKPRANYSRRRYRENIYRPPRRENKRFFWEPPSYDDLSARFNGVPFNVAVHDVGRRSKELSSSMYSFSVEFSLQRMQLYTHKFMIFSILFHSLDWLRFSSSRKRYQFFMWELWPYQATSSKSCSTCLKLILIKNW